MKQQQGHEDDGYALEAWDEEEYEPAEQLNQLANDGTLGHLRTAHNTAITLMLACSMLTTLRGRRREDVGQGGWQGQKWEEEQGQKWGEEQGQKWGEEQGQKWGEEQGQKWGEEQGQRWKQSQVQSLSQNQDQEQRREQQAF
ncbi:hypothetical protein EDB89DRAFT_1905625 [Lactarius sanguifluus]|nr:hypothetical protein EDB89DRAFT_1905625 [Lactarius sanguifluus]